MKPVAVLDRLQRYVKLANIRRILLLLLSIILLSCLPHFTKKYRSSSLSSLTMHVRSSNNKRHPPKPSRKSINKKQIKKAKRTHHYVHAVAEEISPKQLWNINKRVAFPRKYSDAKYLGNCSLSGIRAKTFHLLKLWTKIAADNNIVWFITSGSLIGSLRC